MREERREGQLLVFNQTWQILRINNKKKKHGSSHSYGICKHIGHAQASSFNKILPLSL